MEGKIDETCSKCYAFNTNKEVDKRINSLGITMKATPVPAL